VSLLMRRGIGPLFAAGGVCNVLADVVKVNPEGEAWSISSIRAGPTRSDLAQCSPPVAATVAWPPARGKWGGGGGSGCGQLSVGLRCSRGPRKVRHRGARRDWLRKKGELTVTGA